MKKQRHPSRQEMLKAIESGNVTFRDHLRCCQSCRDLFDLMNLFDQAPIERTPSDQFYDLTAISRSDLSRHPVELVQARVASDSWHQRPAMALRDLGTSLERRIRLRAGRYDVEIHAERIDLKWEFVARVYLRGKPFREYVLVVGRRKLFATRHDCVYWSAVSPGTELQLHTDDGHYQLGVVRW